jgi:hypothetical protein
MSNNNYNDDDDSYDSYDEDDSTKKEALENFMYYYEQYLTSIKNICLRYKIKTNNNNVSLEIIKIDVLISISKSDPVKTIDTFIDKVLPYKNKIKNREQNFFLNNNNIYPEKYKQHTEFFKNLWLDNNGLTNDEKEICFEYFDKFIFHANNYSNLKD